MYLYSGNVSIEIAPHSDDASSTPGVQVFFEDHSTPHFFPASSAPGQWLRDQGIEYVRRRLLDGHFFLHEGQLVAFKEATYGGTIRSQEEIEQLEQTIGLQQYDHNAVSRNHFLSSLRSPISSHLAQFHVRIGHLNEKGGLSAWLLASWTPFSHAIDVSLELSRDHHPGGMACASSAYQWSFPVTTDIARSLNVIKNRLQSDLSRTLSERFIALHDQRSTIEETRRAHSALQKKLRTITSEEDRRPLQDFVSATDVKHHTAKVYTKKALSSKEASDLPSHLSRLDLVDILMAATAPNLPARQTDLKINHLAESLLTSEVETALPMRKPMTSHDALIPDEAVFLHRIRHK